jgi:hypothetical protein
MFKKILITVFIFIILGAAVGFYLWNKPPRNISTAPVEVYISAIELYKAYAANEEASNAKYLAKVIAVEGTVVELQLENEEEPTVALATETEDITVRCGFKKELLPDVKALKPGDKIKIKGKCDGLDMFGMVFTQCTLTK